MNDKQAKKLRKEVYGNESIHGKRDYATDNKSGTIKNTEGSLRAKYQRRKNGDK